MLKYLTLDVLPHIFGVSVMRGTKSFVPCVFVFMCKVTLCKYKKSFVLYLSCGSHLSCAFNIYLLMIKSAINVNLRSSELILAIGLVARKLVTRNKV